MNPISEGGSWKEEVPFNRLEREILRRGPLSPFSKNRCLGPLLRMTCGGGLRGPKKPDN
jgi:hypothetical protein